MRRDPRLMLAALLLVAAACGDAGELAEQGGSDIVADGGQETPSESGPDDTIVPPEPTVPPETTAPPTTRLPGGGVEEPPITLITQPPAKDLPRITLAPAGAAVPVPPPGGPVEKARADLAGRLGADIEAVALVNMDEVTWRDGSLGCPQPGMSYTQALVNGTRIVLEAGGNTFHYHAGGTGDPFYCAHPQEPLTGDGYGDY